MISFPLLKQTFKSTWVIWGVMTVVMSLLLVQFAAMEMTQFLLFLIFYGMMIFILPAIYILISSNKLLAGQVDRGSMAYVLSTPKRRSTVAVTQAVYSVVTVIIMFAISTVAHIAVNAVSPLSMAEAGASMGIMGLAGDLAAGTIVKLNVCACAACLALGGICFMFSGIFNQSKYSSGCSGIVAGVSIIASLMGIFGSQMQNNLEKIKYASVFSFCDVNGILSGTNDWVPLLIIALAIAVVTYTVGSVWFCKKDLPL